MTRQEIFDTLKDIIGSALERTDNMKDVSERSDLRTDVGLNSVGLLYIVISIEERLHVSFDDVSFNDFQTVSDVIDYIERHQG